MGHMGPMGPIGVSPCWENLRWLCAHVFIWAFFFCRRQAKVLQSWWSPGGAGVQQLRSVGEVA